MTNSPRDNDAYRFPVSVKGVIIRGGKVILLRNERDEWESLESYIEQRFATAFTDSICPELLYEARTAAARRSALTRGPICIPWSSGEASVQQCDTEPVPPLLA